MENLPGYTAYAAGGEKIIRQWPKATTVINHKSFT